MNITQLRARYEAARAALVAAHEAIEQAGDDADLDALRSAFDEAQADAERARTAMTDAEARAAAVAAMPELTHLRTETGAPRVDVDVRVTHGEQIYRPDVRASFFGDLMRGRLLGDTAAAERINRHAEHMRDITTVAGADGVLPPQYLTDLYVDLPREVRPVLDALGSRPLPETGMTLTIPRLATGTAVAAQASENAAIQETDADTNQVTVPVRTIAGMQDISQQALDRTDPAFDQIIMDDLRRAYDQEADRQAIVGTGASGQHTGLLTIAGSITVAYTDATPTVEELLPKGHDALQQMWTAIFRSATHVVMHPRRAAWLASAVSPNTPIFPQPTIVMGQRGTQTGGFVQSFCGLPVIVDANVPTNLGAGTNEDRIIFISAMENPFFEGPLNMDVMRGSDPGSGTLTVRIRAYGYSAFASNRRPNAVAIIAGTGLVPPAF